MGVIYKITNMANGKIYIGLTTVSLEERWRNHVGASKKNEKHLYSAMRKYGVENFKIEEIDRDDDFAKLGEKERYYIAMYNSTDSNIGYNNSRGGESNQLDGNPKARLTLEDVKNIRKAYKEGKIGCRECWQEYSDRISFSAFEKIYEGTTWKGVMNEVYTKENKEMHNKFKRCFGEKNGNAFLSDDEVMEIRKFYQNHTLEECYDKYGSKFADKTSFRSVIDHSYLHLPIFSKKEKKWINKNKEL